MRLPWLAPFLLFTLAFVDALAEPAPGDTLLVDLLRDQLGLTGTHVGCDTSQCGACVVHVNGAAVKACTMLAVEADGELEQLVDFLGTVLGKVDEAFHGAISARAVASRATCSGSR